jgi:serine/threonine-protein kinase
MPQVEVADRSAAAARHPTQLGRWELCRRLGQGEWTEVYQARPLGSAATATADYAVKTPLARRADDPAAIRLLRREAEVGRLVNHPHLVAILSAHVERAPYHLVMPFLPGATLARALATCGPMRARHALWIARQIAEALAAMHAQGWRHADVKPENIIISPAAHATLIDLGFARRLDGAECRPGAEIVGTFAYAAPEIFSSALRSGGASDIYALGVVLFEMLTGERPFVAGQMQALVTMHLEEPAPPVRRFAPHLSRRLARSLKRMLAKEPLRRPSAAELVEVLSDLEIDALTEEPLLENSARPLRQPEA